MAKARKELEIHFFSPNQTLNPILFWAAILLSLSLAPFLQRGNLDVTAFLSCRKFAWKLTFHCLFPREAAWRTANLYLGFGHATGRDKTEGGLEDLASILWGLPHPTPGPVAGGETLGVLFAVTTGSSFCLFVCLMKLSPVKSICKQQEVYLFSVTKSFPDCSSLTASKLHCQKNNVV